MPYQYERETDERARPGHSECSVPLQVLLWRCSKLSLSGVCSARSYTPTCSGSGSLIR